MSGGGAQAGCADAARMNLADAAAEPGVITAAPRDDAPLAGCLEVVPDPFGGAGEFYVAGAEVGQGVYYGVVDCWGGADGS